jgi:hypothetical protein
MAGRVFPVFLLAVALGCGCGQRAADKQAAEKLRAAIAAETGDTNTVLIVENGGIQIRSGTQSLTVRQTETTQRPETLPDDIVLPVDAHYDLWTEGTRGCTLSLLTDLTPEPLVEFFRAQWAAHGWQEASAVQADTLRSLTFRKNNRQVSITLEPETDKPGTTRALLFIETIKEN